MQKFKLLFLFIYLIHQKSFSQFADNASNHQNTTAIHKDSTVIIDWAKTCIVNRGPMDISNPELGIASTGEPENAIGKATGSSVVSLGDGGFAILTFNPPIANGDGFDFAIFENGFSDTFLELAFVEVSSDGDNFFRFPSTSNTQTQVQIDGFGSLQTNLVNNLAGKYRALYGTPFDLEELKNENNLDILNISHVKIIDVIGSINDNYKNEDSFGNIINDPWPTPFPNSGFDLDAVGVINNTNTINTNTITVNDIKIYPNPTIDKIYIESILPIENFKVINTLGEIVINQNLLNYSPVIIDFSQIKKGIYFVNYQIKNQVYTSKIIIH